MNTPPATTGSPRFDIDPIRGLVCLSLVFLHFYAFSLPDRFDRFWGESVRHAVVSYRPGVECFMVVAGLLLAHSLRPAPGERIAIGAYLRRRFWRLIVPYWIGVVLAVGNYWAFQLLGKENLAPGFGEVLAQLFLVDEIAGYGRNANIGYWSLVALEQFYLLWIGTYWLLSRMVRPTIGNPYRLEKLMAFPTLIAGLASMVWVYHRAVELQVKFPFEHAFKLGTYAMYLTAGMLLYWAIRMGFARLPAVICLAGLWVLAILGELVMPIKALLIAAVLIPLLLGRRLPDFRLTRGLAWIGKRSYSIYLVHGLVVTRLPFLDGKLPRTWDWIALPELLLGMILSVLLGMIFYRWVEIPCLKKAQSVTYRFGSERA